VVGAFSRSVRLGEGLDSTGRLSEDAMNRALAALKVCAQRMGEVSLVSSRSVATEACRRAENGGLFRDRVLAETGLDLEVISAEEEARLALAACLPLFDAGRPYALVFDIGGGSSEVLWARRGADGAVEMLDVISLPRGIVNLSECFGGTMPAYVYDEVADSIAASVASFERRNRISECLAAGQAQMVGTSGTITTVAAVKLGLARYRRSRVDGTVLSREDVLDTCAWLRAARPAERAAHPCIGYERSNLVLAGCAIMEGLIRQWAAPEVVVADRGLRDGILVGLMAGADPGAVAGAGIAAGRQ
jgi:exopolyphosphatase/guanosine-5'-triphosphate,3'-diphosphate pyrophosphatase